jgi:hypothetical protein
MKAETLRKLAELNLAPEQMAGVLDILADMQEDEEKRRADQRDRVRKHRMKQTCNVTETLQEDTTPPSSPIPLDPPSQTLPPIIPQTPSSTEPQKRARRLADDWALPASWGRWALNEGYSEATIRLQADTFSDFWRAKGGKDAAKLDWEATWRNWMRKIPKSGGRNFGTPSPKPKSEFMQHQDDVQRELDKALGRNRDDKFTGNTLDLETGNWRAH